MYKVVGFLGLFLQFIKVCVAQPAYTDSLKRQLSYQKEDTVKAMLLFKISFSYIGSFSDSGLTYASMALDLSTKLRYQTGIFWAQIATGNTLAIRGNYPLALEYNLKALDLSNKINDDKATCYALGSLSECYFYLGEYPASLAYERDLISRVKRSYPESIYFMWIQLSKIFAASGQSDSALIYAQYARKKVAMTHALSEESLLAPVLGNAFAGIKQYDSALACYYAGLDLATRNNTGTDLVDNEIGIAGIFQQNGKMDSAISYARQALMKPFEVSYPNGQLKAAELLSDLYQQDRQPDSALKYLRLALDVKDSLFNRQKIIAIQNLDYKEKEKQQALIGQQARFLNQLKVGGMLAGLIGLLIAGFFYYRKKRQQQIQQLRNRIADDLHDDIGSELSSISILSELAKSRSPQALPLLISIAESTATIQENMSDIVWSLNPKNDGFVHVLDRMKQFARAILEAKNMALLFNVESSHPAPKLKIADQKNFYLFFKEAINNAAKYASATQVCVSISHKNDIIDMTIADNGIGMDGDGLNAGNGLASFRTRAAALSGKVLINSAPYSGTSVRLIFKFT